MWGVLEAQREGRGWGPGRTEGGQWEWHLQQQLDDIHVYQPQDRLPIDMGDEVSGLQSCLLGGAPLLHALGGNARSAARRGSNSRRPHQAAATHADSVSLTLGAVQRLTRGERTGRALGWEPKDNSPTVRLPAGGISFMHI